MYPRPASLPPLALRQWACLHSGPRHAALCIYILVLKFSRMRDSSPKQVTAFKDVLRLGCTQERADVCLGRLCPGAPSLTANNDRRPLFSPPVASDTLSRHPLSVLPLVHSQVPAREGNKGHYYFHSLSLQQFPH